MLDDNYDAENTDGSILYVHPPNGFSNQQWTYQDSRIVTLRSHYVATFNKDLDRHPFRMLPVDDNKFQKFQIKYSN